MMQPRNTKRTEWMSNVIRALCVVGGCIGCSPSLRNLCFKAHQRNNCQAGARPVSWDSQEQAEQLRASQPGRQRCSPQQMMHPNGALGAGRRKIFKWPLEIGRASCRERV